MFDEEWTRKTKPLNKKALGYLPAPHCLADRLPALPTADKTRRLPPLSPTGDTSRGRDRLLKGHDDPSEGSTHSGMPRSKVAPAASDQMTSKSRSIHHGSSNKNNAAGIEKIQNVATRGQGGVEKKMKFVG